MKTSASSGKRPARPGKTHAGESGPSHQPESPSRSDLVRNDRTEATPPVSPASEVPPATLRRRVRFGYFNPEARDVFLVGSFNGWDPHLTPLRRDAVGDWSVEVELPAGEHRYRLVVDGEWRDDPGAQQTAPNPYGGFDAIMVVV